MEGETDLNTYLDTTASGEANLGRSAPALEQIVNLILSKRRDLTREDIERMIRDEVERASGLLTYESAALILASRLNVDLSGMLVREMEVKVKDLVPGINDVSITGRITLLYPAHIFAKSNGSISRLKRAFLADETGELRVIFWGEKADLVEKAGLSQGQVVRILHGYTREGLDGKLELHVGARGEVMINPPIAKPETFPVKGPTLNLVKISALRDGMLGINVLGRVVHIEPVKSFTRSDGLSGKVVSLIIEDETGAVELVLWNEKADHVSLLKVGDAVLVEGGYFKVSPKGAVSLNLGRAGNIVINPNLEEVKSLPPIGQVTPISQLKEGYVQIIEGTVTRGVEVKEVLTADNEVVKIGSFTISDGTGEANVVVWRKFVDIVEGLTVGSRVVLKHMYARKRLEKFEVSSGKFTSIEVLEVPPPTLIIEATAGKKIGELKVSDVATIHATIDATNARCNAYLACPRCMRKISQREEKFVCERCGDVDAPIKRIVFTVSLADGTGRIDAVFYGTLAERLLRMSSDEVFDAISQGKDFLAKAKDLFSGKKVEAEGRVVYDLFSGDLHYKVYKFRFE